MHQMELETLIRDVPNFPKQGIIFKDITTLLKVPEAFRFAIDAMTEHYRPRHVDVVVAIESRGFIFGAPVAYNLNAAFVPVRKLGKLPAPSVALEYHLEYGTATLEIHKDAIVPGQRVLVVDDLLATGGSVSATIRLVEQLGGRVIGTAFLIELAFLNGRERLRDYEVFALIRY
jgi:adenine phosphoribosyltransferase